jgi:HTH-type transcriptional repressor of NAD biosynthesis genes
VYKRAVICTKAYPLHKGHEYLVNEARRLSENVTLIIVWNHTQMILGETRADWARKTWPDVDVRCVVDIHTDDTKPDSSKLWAIYTRDIMQGLEFDVVFTSEPYGAWWAKELGVKHHQVDALRTRIPISGTAIRNDPYVNWQYINDEAKLHYLKRVLVVGPESTGKTTLCKFLADTYGTVFVPEYGRIYVEQKGSIEETDHRVIFGEIVNRQPQLEREIERLARCVCFYDTDLTTTALWYNLWQSEHVDDDLHQNIWQAAYSEDKYDHILIQDPQGIPWVNDGLRDQETTRTWLFAQLKRQFPSSDVTILQGTFEERQQQAIEAVNKVMREDFDHAPTQMTLPS